MAISKTELESLIARVAQENACVLSVYLNVDQSRSGNLNRGYVRTLKELLRNREQRLTSVEERKAFAASAERVLAHATTFGAPARTLVLFCDATGLFWDRALHIPLESAVRWEQKPYLRPLTEAIDEYERYGVALVDREKARVFTAYLGEIEEHRDILSPEKHKYYRAASKDTNLSQPNLQRREDEHTLWHLKEVAGAMEQMAARNAFDRLILAGPHPVTSELRTILPKKLQTLVVRTLALASDAAPALVLKETMKIEEEVERSNEAALVERLITAASKESQAVLDLQPTLDALRLRRIHELVYVQDLAAQGAECGKCSTLFVEPPEECPLCGGTMRPIPDIVGRLADRVFYSGGHVENVRGPGAVRLREKGSIGAFLRF